MEYNKKLTAEQIKNLENQSHTIIKKIGMYEVQILNYKEMIKEKHAELKEIHKKLWGFLYD